MSLVNRTQISLYEEAQAGLNPLVKQTAQVGVSLVGMVADRGQSASFDSRVKCSWGNCVCCLERREATD